MTFPPHTHFSIVDDFDGLAAEGENDLELDPDETPPHLLQPLDWHFDDKEEPSRH